MKEWASKRMIAASQNVRLRGACVGIVLGGVVQGAEGDQGDPAGRALRGGGGELSLIFFNQIGSLDPD